MLRSLLALCKRRPRKSDPCAEPAAPSLEELKTTLAERGLALWTDGTRLLFSSPKPTLDDGLVSALQRHRGTLVRTLPRSGA